MGYGAKNAPNPPYKIYRGFFKNAAFTQLTRWLSFKYEFAVCADRVPLAEYCILQYS